jgi:hypothetical protein
MLIGKTMKEKKRGHYNKNKLFPGSAIVAAIKRCELICNPAIVSRPRFTIHVRRMREGPTRSWLVSCSDNGALAGEKGKGNEDRNSSEQECNGRVETIHDRNTPEERSSTAKSVSRLQVSATKTK